MWRANPIIVTRCVMNIRDAARALAAQLIPMTWICSVAVGKDSDRDVIYIYVRTIEQSVKLDELRRDGWMGFEVRIEKSGTIGPYKSTTLPGSN